MLPLGQRAVGEREQLVGAGLLALIGSQPHTTAGVFVVVTASWRDGGLYRVGPGEAGIHVHTTQ